MIDITGIINGEGSLLQSLQNPTQWWDYFKNGRTNIINKEIADQNLQYQLDEQQWQHEFAENQREYERQLQQEIFNREDTAIERQAEQLSKLGINPASQELSGLGAGQAVGSSTHNSVTPHNDFQMQDSGIMGVISPILSLVNGINNLNTQGLQRDSIREQNDYQRLLNQEKAIENEFKRRDLELTQEGKEEENRHNKTMNPDTERSNKASANRNEREDIYQDFTGAHDSQSTYSNIATDITWQAERARKGLIDAEIPDKVGDISTQALGTLSKIANEKINETKEKLSEVGSSIKSKAKNGYNWLKTKRKKIQ